MILDPDIDHRDGLGQVRDQGQLPTCLSYSASTVNRDIHELDECLSAEALHYHATDANWDDGSTMNEVQTVLKQEGQPKDHHCNPLSIADPQSWEPPTEVPVYRAESFKQSALSQHVKDLIRDSKLPILGIGTPEEFYRPEQPWIISAGKQRGRHAVVGLGLREYEGETIVMIQNSWGVSWADSGYAWLDDSFLESHLKEVLVLLQDEKHD